MQNRIPGSYMLSEYGIEPRDVVVNALGCKPEQIHENVIVAPFWSASQFEGHLESIVELVRDNVYNFVYKGRPITFLRTGIGAPQTAEAVLALGCTACTRVILTGSVGGLCTEQCIGDVLIPEYAVSGDGYTKYLTGDLWTHRQFEEIHPDGKLVQVVLTVAKAVIAENEIGIHSGAIFTADGIIPQFMYLDEIENRFRCIGIEMEAAATFAAALVTGIRVASIMQISDIAKKGKSLFQGRSEDDQERRRSVRKEHVVRIVLDTLIKEE